LKLRQQLGPKQQPFVNDSPDDLPFREFIRCQEEASFDTRKQVLERLRRYAHEKHRQVAFTTSVVILSDTCF
jgi:hypothetical protein